MNWLIQWINQRECDISVLNMKADRDYLKPCCLLWVNINLSISAAWKNNRIEFQESLACLAVLWFLTHTWVHTLILMTFEMCFWPGLLSVCVNVSVSGLSFMSRAGQTTGGAPVRLVTRCSVCLHWPLTLSRAFLSSFTLHTILMDINSKLSFPDLTYTECVSTALCVCLVLRLNGHVKTVLTPECSSAACSGERFTGWHYSPPISLSLSLLLWEAWCISLTVSGKLPLKTWFRHAQSLRCCSTWFLF